MRILILVVPRGSAVDAHGEIVITLAGLECACVVVGRHVPITAHLCDPQVNYWHKDCM
jgi:hypothetical protein